MNGKQRHKFSETGRVSKAGLLVRGGRIIAMASVLAVTPMVTGFPQVSSPAQAHPVKSDGSQVMYAAGSLWLYPGNGLGGVAGRQPVRGGEGAGHVLG